MTFHDHICNTWQPPEHAMYKCGGSQHSSNAEKLLGPETHPGHQSCLGPVRFLFCLSRTSLAFFCAHDRGSRIIYATNSKDRETAQVASLYYQRRTIHTVPVVVVNTALSGTWHGSHILHPNMFLKIASWEARMGSKCSYVAWE